MKKILLISKPAQNLFTRIYQLILLVLLLSGGNVFGQTSIVSEGLNNSSILFNLLESGAYYIGNSATGDRPATSPFAFEGTYSRGVSNGTSVLSSIDINTSAHTGISLSFKLAAFAIGNKNAGVDADDTVTVEVSPDGGATYFATVRVLGNTDAFWSYAGGTGNASTSYDANATPVNYAPTGGGSRTTDGYSTVTVTGLPAIYNLRVRITLLNNAANERWVVDDFKVTGTAAAPCLGTPTGGTANASSVSVLPNNTTNLFLTGATVASGLAYQWQQSANGSSGWSNVSGIGTNSGYTATITAKTYYRCVVTCSGNSANSTPIEVNLAYCSPTYSSGPGTIDQITNVTLGTLNNSSAGSSAPYYTFYNSVLIPNISASTTASVQVSLGNDPNQFVAAWIDFNQNGIFETSEGLISGNVGASGTATLNFLVPSGATLGNTRMRIRGGDDSALTTSQACGASSSGWGETEDYIVKIIAACTPPQNPLGVISGATPNCNSTALTYTGSDAATGYWQTTANGTNLSFPATTTRNVTLSGTYHVRTYDGDCWSTTSASMAVVINYSPSITTQPLSTSVVTGSTATFTVAATGTTLSYQWQSNASGTWTNVSGVGTNTSYTTAATTLAMNDTNFRVTVTSALCGSAVISSVAVLSVRSPPCFEESYASLTGNGNAWNGNSNFSVSGGVRRQNGAIQISTNNNNGVITSTQGSAINGLSGDITIKMKVKGWSAETVPIKISFGAQSTTINFTGAGDYSSTSYSTILYTFTNITIGSQLVIESLGTTAATRQFLIGEIELYCGIVPNNTCIPSNTISNTVFINKVAFLGTQNDIENISANTAGGFQDFTTLISNSRQIQGEGVNIKVNTSGSAFIKAWIDLNNDGDFVDSQESLFITNIGQSATTFGYQIPISLPAGDYKIRIRVENYNDGFGNDAFGSCDDLFTAGETEDYKLTVLARCFAQVASVSNQERCGAGSVTLVASTISGGVTEFRWFTTAVGGTYTSSTVASNTTVFNTPFISTTTTYYVAAWNGSCETQVRKEVKAVIKEIPEIMFTPAAPVSCDAIQPIELQAEDALETVLLLDENFETNTFAASLFENRLLVDNGLTINSLSNWNQQTSTFIPTLSQLSWLPAVSSGFGANKFAFATSDVGQVSSGVYYTVDTALQMKNAINSTDFTNLTLSFRIYFSRYLSAGVAPDDENVSIEVSINGGTTFTPLSTPIKYVSSQGNPGNFASKVIDVSNYINQPNLKFRIRYLSTTWADGLAIDDVQIYGSKILTASYSWVGSDVSVFTDAALQNEYVSGSAINKVYIVPGETLLQLSSFNINITTTLTNGCILLQPLAVQNNAKIWAGTDANWNSPSNWKPTGVPTANNCIIIPELAILPLIPSATNVTSKTVTVKNNAVLNVPEGSTLTVTDEVHVNTGGTLNILNGGSLVQITNVNNAASNNNVGSVSMQRTTQPMYRLDYTYWSAPVSGNTLIALSPATQLNRFFEWNASAGSWGMLSGGTTTMSPGKGYIVRAPNNFGIDPADPDSYDPFTGTFSGIPNNGTVTTPVSGAASGTNIWNLIGNPYPSAIDAEDFLNANTTVLGGTLYFWTHNSPFGATTYAYSAGDYASWNGSGGIATATDLTSNNFGSPTGKIAAGQGFFVQGIANGDAVFNNSMRIPGDNLQFFRPNPAGNLNNANTTGKHRVWLNLQGATQGFSQTLVGYISNATNGFDSRFDGISFGGNSVTFYSVNEAKNLVIQGRALPFVNTDEVPLGYKTTQTGNLIISIDHVDGLMENQGIYLKDNVLNIVHDLNASPYTFATVPGTFNDRFVLRYVPDAVLDNPTFNDQINGVVIRKNDGTLRISSPYETINNVKVYDIAGRLVFEKKDCNSNTFEANSIVNSEQVLIVKVILNNGGVVTEKVF